MCLFVLLSAWALGQETKAALDTGLPLHIGIVLHASKNTFGQQQAAAIDLIQRLVRSPEDEAFVVTAGGDKPWPYERLDWSNKPQDLVKFTKGLDKNAGLPEAFGFEVQQNNSPNFREWRTMYTGVSPEQSIFAIAAQIMKSDPRPARRVLIMFRDPWQHSPGWGSANAEVIENRHNRVSAMLKDAGVSLYVIGIDEPSTRPRAVATSDPGTSYGTIGFGSGGALRVHDEEMAKALDQLMKAGRQNIERLTKETGGAVAYGNKKDYGDAVPELSEKIGTISGTAVGK